MDSAGSTPARRLCDRLEGRSFAIVVTGRPNPLRLVLRIADGVLHIDIEGTTVEVDRFVGERELVVLPLPEKLGKVQDIAAGALLAGVACSRGSSPAATPAPAVVQVAAAMPSESTPGSHELAPTRPPPPSPA